MSPIAKTLRFVLPAVILLLGTAVLSASYLAYSASEDVTATLENSGPISFTDTVRVTFSHLILQEAGYRERIVVAPSANIYVSWDKEGTVLEFTPEVTWRPETRYTITLPETKATNYAAFSQASLTFETLSYPKVVDVWPSNQTTDALIGIEDPIRVSLDRPTKDFWIDFTITPEIEVVSQHNEDQTYFEILPKVALEGGQEYTVSVIAHPVDGTSSQYQKELHSFSFTTQPPEPSKWSKNATERIAQAKRFTQPRVTQGKYIDINIDAQIMTLFEDGTLLDAYLISSGLAGMDTPKGTFQIHNQHLRPWSRQYELFMPYWMAITPDGKYGIHELPEWPGGYKEGADHLGIPVSHGCVRLGVGAAERVYEWANVGTTVVIY